MVVNPFSQMKASASNRLRRQQSLLKDVVSIDFETSNVERDACSLGVVAVKNDLEVFRENILINPETEFQLETIRVHGIQPHHVDDAPTFPEVVKRLEKLITPSSLVIAHNAKFDLAVLKRNCDRYHIPPPSINFLCSLKLSEAFFPHIPSSNLKNLARELAIPLNHHNSLSDAAAALEVYRHISQELQKLGKTVDEYMAQRGMEFGRLDGQGLKHFTSKASKAYRLPYPKGKELLAFSGKAFCFAGNFTYWNKRQCEQLVIERDGLVKTRMSNQVDYFVVGRPGFFSSQEEFDERILKAKALGKANGRMKVITEEEWITLMKEVLGN